MIVCICHAVSEEQIKECIKKGASSVDEVGEMCYAGTDCGSCIEMIQELLDDNEDENGIV
jgi:bacterioferritin-associated ferredoxin